MQKFACAVEALAEQACGRYASRPRLVDVMRCLAALEARSASEPRLSAVLLQQLCARVEALAVATDAAQRQCEVCCDEWQLGSGGLECCNDGEAQQHFVCFSCLSSMARAATAAAAAAGLRCPGRLGGDGCAAVPYDDAALARGLSSPALAALREAQLTAQRSALECAFAVERAELRRALAEAEARAGRVEALRLDVIDRILTPKCPRCARAFLGFNGCFALRCAPDDDAPEAAVAAAAAAARGGGALRAFCGAAFCGWCFADCGEDAHEHVLACPCNLVGEDYFGTTDLFEVSLRSAQAARLQTYMATLEAPLCAALRVAMRRDLADLDLQLPDA